MREPVRLNGLVAFVVQEGREYILGCTVPFRYRAQVAGRQPLYRAHLLLVRPEGAIVHLHEGLLPLGGGNDSVERVGNYV